MFPVLCIFIALMLPLIGYWCFCTIREDDL